MIYTQNNLKVGDLVKPSSIGWKPLVGIISDVDTAGYLSIIWPDGWISFMHDEREFVKMEEEENGR